MSRTDRKRAGEESPAPAGQNYFNYFTEIEDTFVRRRGRHLLLSPMDWALIESWKEMGVPLHVVLRGVEKAFDSFNARPRKRTVKTLLYCQEEVEAQFAEWRESQLGGHAEDEDRAARDATEQASNETAGDNSGGRGLPFPREVIAAHLADCTAALRDAHASRSRLGVSDELTEALARAAARMEEIERDFEASARPDAELLEASLTDLEALLDRAVRASLAPGEAEAKRAAAAEQLRPYKARMERETYEQTLENLLAKQLREERGLPRLSLFYL